MVNSELIIHSGIPGMKWGRHSSSSKTSPNKASKKDNLTPKLLNKKISQIPTTKLKKGKELVELELLKKQNKKLETYKNLTIAGDVMHILNAFIRGAG